MKVYIAGPISIHEDGNTAAFDAAFAELEEAGHRAINPHHLHGGEDDRPHWWYMRRCLPVLLQCDAVLMLDGWMRSRGAVLERSVAIGCGLIVAYDVAGLER